MKKVWNAPKLEVLDVSKTMGGTDYSKFDGNFNDSQPIPVDPEGNPMIGAS